MKHIRTFLALLALLALSSADDTPGPGIPNGQYPATNYSLDFWRRYFLAIQQAQKTFYQILYSSDGSIETNNVQPVMTGLTLAENIKPVKPATQPECKPVGAYCVYHEECCSFACLSYLAKCVSH